MYVDPAEKIDIYGRTSLSHISYSAIFIFEWIIKNMVGIHLMLFFVG